MPSEFKMDQKKGKHITEKDLHKTYFVPMSRMKEVIDLVNVRRNAQPIRCDYNLLSLKRERSTRQHYDELQERYCAARHRSLYVSSCYKALYAHDWDRLLYILKKVPKWKFQGLDQFHMRLLTILLMYHPESQEKGYLSEYLHMIWGCRLDSDKMAIQKAALTLRKKMFRSKNLDRFLSYSKEDRKEAFQQLEERNKERRARGTL